ncbi:hypothetical protein ACHQM5_017758 [Ranunculus cassubicifolius]
MGRLAIFGKSPHGNGFICQKPIWRSQILGFYHFSNSSALAACSDYGKSFDSNDYDQQRYTVQGMYLFSFLRTQIGCCLKQSMDLSL